MEDISRFFIKKMIFELKNEEIEVTYFHPIDEKVARKAVQQILSPQLMKEVEEVRSKCNLSDRAAVHELVGRGWKVDDGIGGFSKEFELEGSDVKAVMGVSCNDKRLSMSLYRA